MAGIYNPRIKILNASRVILKSLSVLFLIYFLRYADVSCITVRTSEARKTERREGGGCHKGYVN